MAELHIGDIVDRLRANLRGSGIEIRESDIALISEQGFLKPIHYFEEAMRGLSSEHVPDYLADLRDYREEGEGEAQFASPANTSPLPKLPPRAAGPEALDLPIHRLAALVAAGSLSPVDLVQASLGRIKTRGDELNAFQCCLDEDALEAASCAEKEIRSGFYRGPLHGIPIAIKDNLDLAGSPTRAGSIVLEMKAAIRDSSAAMRLKAAGAIVVGKTRMSEFAYSPGSNNDHFGSTRNPWDPDRDTGGSSSGSAAAVADRMVSAALGTDTGGSIRIPASYCGLVGLKPTFGRLGLGGAVSLSWSLDHLGSLTRSVEDAAILLDALAGFDPRDRRTRAGAVRAVAPWLAARIGRGLKGLRIGVLRDETKGSPLGTEEVISAWRAGLAVLADSGAELIELDLPELKPLRVLNSTLLAIEAAAFHAPMMREGLAAYGDFTRLRLLVGCAYGPLDLTRAEIGRATLRRRCDAIFEKIDLLCTPTTPAEAPSLGTPGRLIFTSPFNLLGWPALSLPSGRTREGLPLGIQLVGRPWDEANVLLAAAAIEAGLSHQADWISGPAT